MNVSNLLSYDPPPPTQPQAGTDGTHHEHQQRVHQYPTRHSVSTHLPTAGNGALPPSANDNYGSSQQKHSSSHEPNASPVPKNVAFELLFDHPNTRARLPMRVQIFPHDTTDSIVTTVKNFYGLYDGSATGVSFEDDRGNTLIARYENFRNDMIVYVRVISDYSPSSFHPGQIAWNSASPISSGRVPHLDEAFQMPPPQHPQYNGHDQPISRPGSRVARKKSASPRPSRNRRSLSAQKMRSHSGVKSRDTSLPRTTEELNNDAMNGYSDSDCGAGSVTSSFKARSEQLASAEISVDNIVEGGRRKRAKFESSVSLPSKSWWQINTPSNIVFFQGIALVCPSSGTRNQFNLVYIPPTAVQWPRKSITIRTTTSAGFHIPTVASVSPKLWKQRASVWNRCFEQHLSLRNATVRVARSPPSRSCKCYTLIISGTDRSGVSTASVRNTSYT